MNEARPISPTHRCGADLSLADISTAGSANITFASTAPPIPPAIWTNA